MTVDGERPEDMLRRRGDSPAIVMSGSRRIVTYAELDDQSTRLARIFDDRGMRPGDHVAVLLGNQPEFFDVLWAALRSGMYLTPINWHLGAEEAAYIIEDSGAQALITSSDLAGVAAELLLRNPRVTTRLMTGDSIDGYDDYESTLASASGGPRTDEVAGAFMLYSSGTTGYPKGILRKLPSAPFGAGSDAISMMMTGLYGATENSVYLSPAPLYHSAPIGFCSAVHRFGGTAVVMERFDATATLRSIEEHAVTHAQFVPTHFIRMLQLPDEERTSFDISSLECVIHASAPCPIPVKHRMIEWFGPIIEEFYAGSEAIGVTLITSAEWLEHPGSVGRPAEGSVHILDEHGHELSVGETGHIWFVATSRFEYNNDPAKTRKAQDPRGWASYGDIGYLDEAGYLYLTDRASNMIISGGVNIYPQESEMVLSAHPDIYDVAVLGVPDDEMGERVKAFVQLCQGAEPNEQLAQALVEYCRSRLAHYKCPREIDFVDTLPRLDSGKLLKRKLIEEQPAGS